MLNKISKLFSLSSMKMAVIQFHYEIHINDYSMKIVNLHEEIINLSYVSIKTP